MIPVKEKKGKNKQTNETTVKVNGIIVRHRLRKQANVSLSVDQKVQRYDYYLNPNIAFPIISYRNNHFLAMLRHFGCRRHRSNSMNSYLDRSKDDMWGEGEEEWGLRGL